MNARSIMCWMAVAVAAIAAAIAATPLNDIPGTTEMYSAAETDARIVELGGTPGDYANVSNAAVNAGWRATNYTDAVAAEFESGARVAQEANYASSANSAFGAFYLYDDAQAGEIYPSDIMRGATNAAISVAASKQDALPYPTNAIPFSVIVGAPSLAGQTFDFSRNYDIIRVTAAIAEALGATITNNPTAQGGN